MLATRWSLLLVGSMSCVNDGNGEEEREYATLEPLSVGPIGMV